MEKFEGRRGILTTGEWCNKHSQQYVAPCVKVLEWGLGTGGLRMLAAFWAGIPTEVTQEAGVVPRLYTRCHRDTFLRRKKRWAYSTTNPQGDYRIPTNMVNPAIYDSPSCCH